MKLLLQRHKPEAHHMMGDLFVDGVRFCFTLEDIPRAVKVMHETCIPAGTYKVDMTKSQRFGKVMPILLNVPGFTGIRIHSGNTAEDTSGCILVGFVHALDTHLPLMRSSAAFADLMMRLDKAFDYHEDVTIEVKDAI